MNYKENEIIEVIKKMWSNNQNKDIAKHLTNLGYTTKTGCIISGQLVSKLGLIEGLPVKRKRPTGIKVNKVVDLQVNDAVSIPVDPKDLPEVLHDGKKTFTTSLNIASVFGKNHKDVLRSIDNLHCSYEFKEKHFTLTEYIGANGKNRAFHLTKDGFLFLVMGYTGSEAGKLKEAYINRFNLMENRLKEQQQNQIFSPNATGAFAPTQLNQLQVLQQAINYLVDLDQRQTKTENKLNQLIENQQYNQQQLLEVERSDLLPFDKTIRDKIRQLVFTYARATNTPINIVWGQLYTEMYYRYKIDVWKRSRNKNINKLDVILQAGLMNELFSVASKILIIKENDRM